MGALRGKTFEVLIDISGTPTLIGKGFQYDRSSTRQTTERAVFGDTETLKTTGPRSTTLSFSYVKDLEDAGQNAFRAARDADPEDNVTLVIMYDEDNGYSQEFQIGDEGETSTPEGFTEENFSLSPVGAKTPVTGS